MSSRLFLEDWISLGLRRFEAPGKPGSRAYSIGPVMIHISYDSGRGTYIYGVHEPPLEEGAEDVVRDILRLVSRGALPYTGVDELIAAYLEREPERRDEVSGSYGIIKYYLEKSLSGYGPLYPLMLDDLVEEVAVEGPGIPVAVMHRSYSDGWMDTNIVLEHDELDSIVLSLARMARRHLSVAVPVAEGLTPEGHRVALTFSREVSRRGSSLVIRKHPRNPLTIADLVRNRTLSPLEAAYLWMLVEARAFIMIVGEMASGKTSLLQALLTLIPPDKRIVTLEDTPELRLPHTHWDPLVARETYISGSGASIDLYALARFALRRRSDYIVIGEVRGEEARVLAQAAATGHGSLCTMHADGPGSLLVRLSSPPISLGKSFLSLIWAVPVLRRVRLKRSRRLARRLISIYELDEDLSVIPVFSWDSRLDAHEPSDPETVIDRSYRLRRWGEIAGYDAQELSEELARRTLFLEKISSNKGISYVEVARAVAEYYARATA